MAENVRARRIRVAEEAGVRCDDQRASVLQSFLGVDNVDRCLDRRLHEYGYAALIVAGGDDRRKVP